MGGSSIGDRMKAYEGVTTAATLTRRVPVIVRMDGRAFHTFSKDLVSPYDDVFHKCMCFAMIKLCEGMPGARLGFHFSDEISILLTDYETIDTEPHFGYNLQKIISVTASECTARFAEARLWMDPLHDPSIPQFDCRAFNVPADDIVNYFVWRQRDCSRNSIQMAARVHYSHEEMLNKSSSMLQDMLMEKGVNWNHCDTRVKRGICSFDQMWGCDPSKWVLDYDTPIFTKDRGYVGRRVHSAPLVDDGELHLEGCQLALQDIGFMPAPALKFTQS